MYPSEHQWRMTAETHRLVPDEDKLAVYMKIVRLLLEVSTFLLPSLALRLTRSVRRIRSSTDLLLPGIPPHPARE